MSDNLLPAKESRSTCINPRTTSHQRRTSVQLSNIHLNSHSDKSSHPSHARPLLSPQASVSEPVPLSFNPPSSKQRSTYGGSLRHLYHQWMGSLYGFLDPAGPLLPHNKHGAAFGGTQKRSLASGLLRSRWLRFLVLLYCIFSVFLSINHGWHWLRSGPTLDPRFGKQWVAQRTYDQDQTYSVVDTMTHGLKMAKMMSKSFHKSTENVEPYWLKASLVPEANDVTLTTLVTPETWHDLVRLAEHWHGFMSATLQVMEKDSHAQLEMIKSAYDNNVQLRTRLDLHVTVQPTLEPSVLFSRNSQRNLARLFARTDYIIDMPTSMIPATDLHKTFEINRDIFEEVLDVGDVLVVPTFGFHQSNVDSYTIPHHKTRLLELVDSKQMSMIDKHSEPNHGPTNATLWRDAQTLYTVENYEFHYEPIVLESKRVQPWCAERFIDNRYACYFASYLSGTQFRVLPDDFVVQLPQVKSNELSDFDRVIEDRLYAKFFWEKCVHHARQLDALNLWNTPKSLHLHSQCSRVIQNWGKGLIGKI